METTLDRIDHDQLLGPDRFTHIYHVDRSLDVALCGHRRTRPISGPYYPGKPAKRERCIVCLEMAQGLFGG